MSSVSLLLKSTKLSLMVTHVSFVSVKNHFSFVAALIHSTMQVYVFEANKRVVWVEGVHWGRQMCLSGCYWHTMKDEVGCRHMVTWTGKIMEIWSLVFFCHVWPSKVSNGNLNYMLSVLSGTGTTHVEILISSWAKFASLCFWLYVRSQWDHPVWIQATWLPRGIWTIKINQSALWQ